jgi:hypothetical protein
MRFAAVHESASGTSRQFAATQHFGRFRSKADIERRAYRTRIYESRPSESHADLYRSADISIFRLRTRPGQDFEVSAVRAWQVKVGKLVSRFRSSHHCAAVSFANFGIEGHYQLIDLVWLWLRSPHFGLANKNDADF